MVSFLKQIFGKKRQQDVVEETYLKIMSQSRHAALYQYFYVPDTMTGRFESLTLHLFFVLNRLRGQGEVYESFAQELIDHLVVQLGHALREDGVSDTKVAKKIKSMLTLFYGRIRAYDGAVERMNEQGEVKSDPELIDFFARTIFEKNQDPKQNAADFEAYFQNAQLVMQKKPLEDILSNQLKNDEYQPVLTKLLK